MVAVLVNLDEAQADLEAKGYQILGKKITSRVCSGILYLKGDYVF